MDGNNHYIRTDTNGIVILAFSDAFPEIATPEPTDICVATDAGRHYNPQLTNERGQYLYKWDGTQMVERSQSELDTEWSARPAPPPSENDRLASLEAALLSLMGL